ncbi:MAG: FlgD immunoglobulin-like domain containing protein [Fidelibacterota bacterium]
MAECTVFTNPFVPVGVTQTIELIPFMNNLISFYVEGDDMSTDTVFGDGVLIAANDDGGFYVPSYGIDGIGMIENTEGYKVFANGDFNPVTLTVFGSMMDPNTVYQWNPFMNNLFGYPYDESMSSETAFGAYDDDILIISNDQGEFYVPSYGIATLSEVVSGKGYSVFVNGDNAIGFTYPAMATGVSRDNNAADIEAYKTESKSQKYDVISTGNPYAIILTELEGFVSAGDEVAAYAHGELVGAARIADMNMPVIISAWGAIDGYNIHVPGFEIGDAIELRVWSQSENKELRVSSDLDNYQYGIAPLTTGSIVVLNEDPVPTSFTLGQNYPNPFNPSTTISFTVPSEMQVELAVYDITGRLVKTLINNQMVNTGYHNVVWDGKDKSGNTVSAGLYICSLKGEGMVQTQKMVMLK